MKIVKEKKDVVKFGDLKCGDVFIYCGDICLKVGNAISEPNAYDLQENVLNLIFNAEEVMPIEAELVIK